MSITERAAAQAKCQHGDAWIPQAQGEGQQCAKCGKARSEYEAEVASANGQQVALPLHWPPAPMQLSHSYFGYVLRNMGTGEIYVSKDLSAFSGWEILDPTTYKPLGVAP